MERAPRQETHSPEKIEYVFEHIVQDSKIVGSGKDGIVFCVEFNNLSPDDREELKIIGLDDDVSVAAKILKIYNPELGRREFDMQKRALEIVTSQGGEGLCRVPDIALVRDQHITTDTATILNGQGAQLGDRAEVLVMDFIEGKDLGTLMYDFVLAAENFEVETIDEMNFAQKEHEVARILQFEIPDISRALDQQAIDTAYARTFTRNEEKLRSYLRRHGFILKPEILEKVKKTIDVLHVHGLYHNDLHKRNVMVGDDGETYLIDFGRSGTTKNGHGLDDANFVQEWKELTRSAEEKIQEEHQANRKSIDELLRRVTANSAQRERIEKNAELVAKRGISALESAMALARASDSALEMFLVTLAVLGRRNDAVAETVHLFVADMLSPQHRWRPFERNLIKRFVDTNSFTA